MTVTSVVKNAAVNWVTYRFLFSFFIIRFELIESPDVVLVAPLPVADVKRQGEREQRGD